MNLETVKNSGKQIKLTIANDRISFKFGTGNKNKMLFSDITKESLDNFLNELALYKELGDVFPSQTIRGMAVFQDDCFIFKMRTAGHSNSNYNHVNRLNWGSVIWNFKIGVITINKNNSIL